MMRLRPRSATPRSQAAPIAPGGGRQGYARIHANESCVAATGGVGVGLRRRGLPGAGVARRRRRRVARRRIALVGGMVAFGAHKMSQSQAEKIQEHTGVPPEELEDADLEAAMTELGIPKQELTDEDRAAGAGE